MSDLQDNVSRAHNHGAGAQLDPAAEAILQRGLRELLRMADGLKFRPLPGESYPLPLVRAAYVAMPTPEAVRADVQERMNSDPASVLEYALALLELHECNQGDIAQYVQEDMPFIGTCFSSKRCNGWIALMGDADRAEAEAAINRRWQFKFFSGRAGPTGVYALLNMLARYGFVYGRVEAGDAHGLSHFVEEYCPGLLVCRGRMSDLELTLSLAAMKMGIPAIVPRDYPFRLGRMLRMDTLNEVVESVCAFPNIRRLLRTPEIPPMPDYCDEENAGRAFTVHATWGNTPESFFIVRKGRVASPGVAASGRAGKGIGIEVTIEAEPMDAFDRRYIESSIAGSLSLVRGAKVRFDAQTFAIDMAEQTDLTPERVGEVLLAAVRRNWPKLDRVRAAVCFDPEQLRRRAPVVRGEKAARGREILAATEENADRFYQCVGCSPFAPDHVCCLTPERPPQCGRPFEMIKTGALYGYDALGSSDYRAQFRSLHACESRQRHNRRCRHRDNRRRSGRSGCGSGNCRYRRSPQNVREENDYGMRQAGAERDDRERRKRPAGFEVMAIGRTFKEALMKGIRSLETGRKTPTSPSDPAELERRLALTASRAPVGFPARLRDRIQRRVVVRNHAHRPVVFCNQLQQILELKAELKRFTLETHSRQRFVSCQAIWIFRSFARGTLGEERRGSSAAPPGAQCAACFQTRGYVRGGIRVFYTLSVFDLRRGRRGRAHHTPQDYDSGQRP